MARGLHRRRTIGLLARTGGLTAAACALIAGPATALHLFPPLGRQTRLPFRQNPEDFARYMGEVESERWGFDVSFSDLSDCSATKVFATKVYHCFAGTMTRTAPAPYSPGCVPSEMAMLYFEQNTDTGRRYHVTRAKPCLADLPADPVPAPMPAPMVSEPIRGLW
ncbi:hypothetical protein EVJ50_01250 [Synechococcus sp. RSCCF101]|uniref:hypothetical protein n=1 Tax=Synechococcus sp. RSCCF101 TaxID=2511069 RepID=UPI0012444BDD|nr:hypothetical protein [Synechococcus sp. RSCCF101]QEY31084.1 hypothetical protein EVJ50_01250 [Synechococcus sp. RSCCF101]